LIDWGSNAVNGQLVPQAPTSAFFPLTLGAQYRGPGMWPRQGTYQVPPVIPSPGILGGTSPNATGAIDPSTGGLSIGSPWHPTQGTIVFALGALILGLFGLHFIHYGA
jgi:hypothetical protein